jgi:hypothetical protein
VAVVAAIPDATPQPRAGTTLILVNMIPQYLTAVELEDIDSGTRAAIEAYGEAPTDYNRGLSYGLAGVAAGAIIWGLVGAYLELQSWVIAVGAGYLIAGLTVQGAGKVTRGVQVLIGALTVGTAFAGLILIIAFTSYRHLGGFDLLDAGRIFFEEFDSFRGDALFGIGGGLIDAFNAARSVTVPTLDRNIG